MEPIKAAFFTHDMPNSPLEYLRVIGPISHTDITLRAGPELKENIYQSIDNSDLIIIQRVFPAEFNITSEILEISKELRKPVIYDLDDNLFLLPENHPHRKTFGIQRVLMPMLFTAMNVDCITVSTEYLKSSLKGVNQNVYVLPNLLDDSIWPISPPKTDKDKKQLTIGYMGGDSHYFDLEMIVSPLVEIKGKYHEKIRFHFYGVKPPEEVLAFPDTIWTPSNTYNYKEFIEDFKKLDFDIFIAPLVDNEFNRCKSAIKFMEYSTFGKPGVFSRIPPYTDIITDGENGMLAGDLIEWRNKIQLLIENPDISFRLAKNAQNFVKDYWIMSRKANLWESTYRKVIAQGKSSNNSNNAPQEFIEAITHQSIEFQKFADISNANTLSELNVANLTLDNLQNEVSSYQGEIKNRDHEMDILKNNLLSLQTQIETNNVLTANRESNILRLQKSLAVREKELKIKSNQVSTLEEELNTRIDQVSTLEKNLSSHEQELINVNSDVLILQDIIKHRDREIFNLNREVDTLTEEVLFYALSRSWRFTRPFRKFKKNIWFKKND